ncbi:MAG: hypothetical protein AB1700_06950 [Bacillota bacterium]
MEKVTSLCELEELVRRQSDADYARLFIRFGTVWLLPDSETGVGTRSGGSGFHPWVVIEDYREHSPVVLCALRTTTGGPGPGRLFVLGGVIQGLSENGWITVPLRRALPIRLLREYEKGFVATLPNDVAERLRELIRALPGGSR